MADKIKLGMFEKEVKVDPNSLVDELRHTSIMRRKYEDLAMWKKRHLALQRKLQSFDHNTEKTNSEDKRMMEEEEKAEKERKKRSRESQFSSTLINLAQKII